jgi:chaperonin GroEL (HSP60 family)
MEISKYLRDHARTISGKQQMLINAFAKALEIIPRQLADNAGLDSTDILNKLRQRHAQPSEFHSFATFLTLMKLFSSQYDLYLILSSIIKTESSQN